MHSLYLNSITTFSIKWSQTAGKVVRKIDMADAEIEIPEINTSSSHFLRAQQSGPPLSNLWERAKTNTGSYCVVENLLYKLA